MNNKKVIYTAIFGNYDKLEEPAYLPKGFDFVCFSDKKIKSKNWQVRVVTPAYDDPTRNARMYKILPHRYLGGYEESVWVDGNILLRGDTNELIEEYLKNANMAVYSHSHARHRDRGETPDTRDCVYEEADHLISLASRGRVKDDPKIIEKQIENYRTSGYPAHNGLLLSMVLFRRHNKPDVIKAMEEWWSQLKGGSKRDQLSFNYSAWKMGLKFEYIDDNVRNNPYFLCMPHKR